MLHRAVGWPGRAACAALWLVAVTLGSACAPGPAVAAGPAGAAGGPALPLTLNCRIDGPATLKAGQAAVFTMTLSNPGPQALDFLHWATPFEAGWFGAWLELLRDGQALVYGGPSVKRAAPRAADYTRLQPGQMRQASFDLSPVFDLRRPGRYVIQPQLVLFDVVPAGAAALPRARGDLVALPLVCPERVFEITP